LLTNLGLREAVRYRSAWPRYDQSLRHEFGGTTASDLAHSHTWAEEIDHLLATEDISSLVTPGGVIWALNDHLGTARDLVDYDTGTNTPGVENHREYNSFGILVSQTNGAFSITFGFTGVFYDVVTSLNYHRARWYGPCRRHSAILHKGV
jgi:hypothetical protein